MASNRILLINEEIQKELSALLRTVKDPRVQAKTEAAMAAPVLRVHYFQNAVNYFQHESEPHPKKALDIFRQRVQQSAQIGHLSPLLWQESAPHPE